MTRSKGHSGRPYLRMRQRVLASSSICAGCGEAIATNPPYRWPHPLSPSVDHIIPVSRLPADSPLLTDVANGRPMHLRCNQLRGDGTRQEPSVRYSHPISRNWYA